MLIAVVTGCGGDGSGPPTGPAATGNLTVTVAQIGSVPASVRVTGPSGYDHALTATTTLSGLPVGTYTVSADSTEAPDSIVGAIVFTAQVSGSPAAVTKDVTKQASVTYAVAHRRGALWVASPNNEAVAAFGVDHLRAAGTIQSQAEAFAILPNGIAFDGRGVMWISALDEDTLRAFTIAQRITSGMLSATLKLQSPSLNTPEQMAFDRNGTLWVSDYLNGLVGFSAAQLTAGGTGISAAFHVQDTSSANPGMQSVAFDAEGNAWAAEALAKQVVEYTAAQLAHSGTVAPAVRITSTFRNPVDVTFDSHDNLWVADVDAATVEMFAPAQRASSGAPVPTISVAGGGPYGIAFDNSGSLWMSSKFGNDIDMLSAASLSSPDPWSSVLRFYPTISGQAYPDLGKIAFDPWITAAALSGTTSVERDRVPTVQASGRQHE